MSIEAPRLSRTVGVPGAVLLGLGSMLGTGVFVGVALAADVAGPAVVPATLAAAALALCNALSSAQLAAAHPVSGGTYEYGHRLLGYRGWPGFLAGWLFLGAKGASAATAAVGLVGYLLAFVPGAGDWWVGTGAALFVLAMTAFVAGGLRRSNWGNAALVTVAATGLLYFLLEASRGRSTAPSDLLQVRPTLRGFLEAAALMFVAFAGYGRLATLGEEVKDPTRSIPKAVMITIGVTAVLYVLVAWGTDHLLQLVPLGSAPAVGGPLAELVRRVAPEDGALGPALVTAGAFAALGGSLLNLLLGLSRVLLAMARRGEMPPWFAAVSNDSPRRAVWAVGLAVAAGAACGSVKLAWSVSACAVLLYYGLTNAAALRLPAEQRRYPRAIAWVGLVGCASLAWFVTPVAAAIVGGWLLAGVAWRAMMRGRTSPGRAA
ncbi:APC family permease [Alienimonas californiensis]|uniref:Putative amino acid permease YhdG n=1 Tax=Alienimonas californiensis TaxID=2527989 RepID=A0A517P6V1_9PLAN|nr:APC family permease [Alienimonas californiensis]QDT15091.1 putative amino acid permease YhdG [Alienimonas californiensis]